MPAISTQRRSCSSPHWPRVCGWRRAFFRPGGLGVEVADRLPHLLDQGAGLQVGLAAPPDLLLDLLLALGDPLGQRLDLRLALLERRLGGLGVELARLVVGLQEARQRLGDGLRGGLLDGGAEVGLLGRLLAGESERVDEPRGEQDDGDGEDDGHRPPMLTGRPDATAGEPPQQRN